MPVVEHINVIRVSSCDMFIDIFLYDGYMKQKVIYELAVCI